MRISLRRPFRVAIDVVETDKRLPSMCCNLTVEAEQFGQKLRFIGRVWICCSTWDLFADGLADEDCPDLELYDMDRRVALRISKAAAGVQFSFEAARTDVSGTVGKMTICTPLHRDEFVVVAREFADFDRWW
jgi:hypothetical protein